MTAFGQLMLLFSTFGQVMLPYPDGRSKMFNGFMVVVALKMDSLCFLFGQLMVQVTKLPIDKPIGLWFFGGVKKPSTPKPPRLCQLLSDCSPSDQFR